MSEGEIDYMSRVPYASIVGSLMYDMVCTRPNLAHAVSVVSRFMGYVFTLGGSVVSWKATLQSTVTLSTTEAEYMALTEAAKEAIWLRGLVSDLGLHHDQARTADNPADMFTKPVPHRKFKHCLNLLNISSC
ncbi:hypothetical protein YC2023_097994 [Brassica napus]